MDFLCAAEAAGFLLPSLFHAVSSVPHTRQRPTMSRVRGRCRPAVGRHSAAGAGAERPPIAPGRRHTGPDEIAVDDASYAAGTAAAAAERTENEAC